MVKFEKLPMSTQQSIREVVADQIQQSSPSTVPDKFCQDWIDQTIMKDGKRGILDAILVWEGIQGFTSLIMDSVSGIFNVKLPEA